MYMRYFKDFYKKLKTSFDAKGGTFCFADDTKLSPRDVYRLRDVMQMWCCVVFDAYRHLTNLPQAKLSYYPIQWIWKLFRLGVGIDYLFECLKALVNCCRHDYSLTKWKAVVDDYGEIGRSVLDIILPLMARRKSPLGFMYLHWVLVFISKMGFEHEQLRTQGVTSWFDHEAWLRTCRPVYYLDDSDRIRDIICHWLSGWTPASMTCGYYTNGSTANAGKDVYQKLLAKDVTPDLALLACREAPHLCDVAPLRIGVDHFMSKWTQVPKNALTLREISMEPAALNWWQSALDDSIRRLIRRSPLSKHYDPEDQNASRLMCVSGSLHGHLATIDLSKASDCVRPDMVRTWFPQQLQRWLFATRSSTADVNGDEVLLEKFAPMGSRLTFDIESIIFAALAKVAEERAGIPESCQSFRVYGDDIIVDTAAAPYLVKLLTECGFQCNTEKSFWSGPFREACGAFAYQGVDVTMPGLPRRAFDPLDQADSGTISWLSALANRCYYSQAMMLRYFCVCKILDYGTPRFHPPSLEEWARIMFGEAQKEFADLGHFSLVSDQPTEWRMVKRPIRLHWAVRRLPGMREVLSPPRENDYGHRRALVLTPMSQTIDRVDDEAYAVWLYQADQRGGTTPPSGDVPLTCRTKEQHALPPRETWYTLPG